MESALGIAMGLAIAGFGVAIWTGYFERVPEFSRKSATLVTAGIAICAISAWNALRSGGDIATLVAALFGIVAMAAAIATIVGVVWLPAWAKPKWERDHDSQGPGGTS